MKRLVLIALLSTFGWGPARATCAGGFDIRLSGQLPDITFTSGVPSTIRFKPWYVSFPSNSGSCGIFARSTTPGVSIQGTYGCPAEGCPIGSPGEWVGVGNAYQTLFDRIVQKDTDIPIIFDGSTPAGTYGTIEIGIRDNDVGIPSHGIIGTINVYIESAEPPPTWFLVATNAGNVSGDRVLLDHPHLNGSPGNNLFVSHVRNPGGLPFGTVWDHPVAVEYDPFAARWTIRNMDAVPMPTGLAFAVRIDPTALLYCTSSFPFPYPHVGIWHVAANGNPWAQVMVTPIGGPPHPVAVRYDAPEWRIVYADGATIPPSTCFNVQVFAFSQYLNDPAAGDFSGRLNVTADWGTGVDLGGIGSGHTSGSARVLQFDWALGSSTGFLMTTPNINPIGLTPYVEPGNFGTSAPSQIVVGQRWALYQEDGSPMPLAARFNVWGPCAASAWYPDADGDGYGVEGPVQASCGRPAGHASRPGDCDDTDPTRYPGSPEINDGQDNQCPGEPGHGTADELSGMLVFIDEDTLCWPGQTGASGYQVGRSGDRSFEPCSDAVPASGNCATDPGLPAEGQTFHYLVRPQTPWPGSWGADSAGEERLLSCP